MPNISQDDLILSIHRSALDMNLWEDTTDKIRDFVDADYCSLALRAPKSDVRDTQIIFRGDAKSKPRAGMSIAYCKSLQNIFYEIDSDKPHRFSEIVHTDDWRYGAYRTYLNDRSLGFGMTVRVFDPAIGHIWLTAGRAHRDFSDDIIDTLRVLAPHLTVAVQNLSKLKRTEFRRDIATDISRRKNVGYIVFDRDGRPLEIDPQAEEVLRRNGNLRPISAGAMLPLSGQARLTLKQALVDFESGQVTNPCIVHLFDNPWTDMLLVPIGEPLAFGEKTAVAVAYVSDTMSEHRGRAEWLQAQFSLTPSEARLAAALSSGKRIAEAATDLNVTTETARIYSKRIYSKTGTHGQIELIRLIHGGVFGLA